MKSDNREMTQDNLNLQNKVFDLTGELNRFREQQKSDTSNDKDKSSDKEKQEKHIRDQLE